MAVTGPRWEFLISRQRGGQIGYPEIAIFYLEAIEGHHVFVPFI